MEYKNIKYITKETKLKNTIGYLYLDRVDKANALSIEMLTELNHLLDDLTHYSNLKVLIISSNGKHFCAGADLSWMSGSDDTYTLASSLLFDFLDKLNTLSIPKISMVHGACYGGGVGILGATDIVISDTNSKFCLSEAKIGLIPAIILPFLKNRVKYSSLINMGLKANVLDSKMGLDVGIVDIIGSSDVLESIVNDLLSCSLNAQIEFKNHCKKIFSNDDLGRATLKEYCLSVLSRVKNTESAKEGMLSFLNKKEPNWKDSL